MAFSKSFIPLNRNELLIFIVSLILIIKCSQCQQMKCNYSLPIKESDKYGVVLAYPIDDLNYPNNVDSCWFKLETNQTNGVFIQFTKFNLANQKCLDKNGQSKCCDYLEIGTGSNVSENLINTVCGGKQLESLYVNSSQVWLNFHSDESITSKGFKLNMKPFTRVFNSQSGFISNPLASEDYYQNNLDLTYNIITSNDSFIWIRFTGKFDIEKNEDVCYDYLEIGPLEHSNKRSIMKTLKSKRGDKTDEPIRVCGNEMPGLLSFNTNKVYLRFVTDDSEVGKGFNLNYGSIKYIYTEPNGFIKSPINPINITYTIRAPENQKIELNIDSFDFSDCLANETVQIVSSPFLACSQFNDYLKISNKKGNMEDDIYDSITKLSSTDPTLNKAAWTFCACNKPVKKLISFSNEIKIEYFLSRKDSNLRNSFNLTYKFIRGEFSQNNQLRIVQDYTKSFIGGYLLRVNVPVNNHLRLYGKSDKCTLPKSTTLAKKIMSQENIENNDVLQIQKLNRTNDLNKGCSYLFDLSEPARSDLEESNQNYTSWQVIWYLKFENSFELYDFELNWVFEKNKIIDEKKSSSLMFPLQHGFDINEELIYTFKSLYDRRYTLYFETNTSSIKNVDSDSLRKIDYFKINTNAAKNDQLIKINSFKSQTQTDKPTITLDSNESVLKLKRYNKWYMNITYELNSNAGDCDFDYSFCSYTTNALLNTTLFNDSISDRLITKGFTINHVPKYNFLDNNDIFIEEKAEDFYLQIKKSPESKINRASIFSPLIQVQNKTKKHSNKKSHIKLNRKVFALSFDYYLQSADKLEIFITPNRSDISDELKFNFTHSIEKVFEVVPKHTDELVFQNNTSNCQNAQFSSILESFDSKRIPKTSSIHEKTLNWRRQKKIPIFSCYDFRFVVSVVFPKKDLNESENPTSKESTTGLDNIELNYEKDVEECDDNICGTNGKCFKFDEKPICCCNTGYDGKTCENKLNACELLGDQNETCMNGGKCVEKSDEFDYECACASGFTGRNCEIEINECESSPCQHNSICTDLIGSYECSCPSGTAGTNCETLQPGCNEKCDQKGTTGCINDEIDIICLCKAGFSGDDCGTRLNTCKSNPCYETSTCEDTDEGFECNCPEDRSGKYCEVKLNYCETFGSVCENDSICEYANGDGSIVNCACAAGFIGKFCNISNNECDSNPCISGTCVDLHLGYRCDCPNDKRGINCEFENDDPCFYHKCQNGGECRKNGKSYYCECDDKTTGTFCEIELCNIEKYWKESCNHTGTYKAEEVNGNCKCTCKYGFTGAKCDEKQNLCEIEKDFCKNDGECKYNKNKDQIECECLEGFSGDRCELVQNYCKTNPCKYGKCVNDLKSFKCQCTKGWKGEKCDEPEINCDENSDCHLENTVSAFYSRIDGDLKCGCVCKDGYGGDKCEVDIDDCKLLKDPCNNGTCIDMLGTFRCECNNGFSGPRCDKIVTDCESRPCNNGTCELQGTQIKCNCLKGYEGKFCEIPIDKCEPNPCQNEGVCHNLIDDYYCSCLPEYGQSKNCTVRLEDPCLSSPCFNNATCMAITIYSAEYPDKTVFSGFKCNCPSGFVGELCEMKTDQCSSNPCNNRGRCGIGKDEKYFCSCFPAFKGKNCEEEYNPCLKDHTCKNGGTCVPTPEGPECKCSNNFIGNRCETELNPCNNMNCTNNGKCILDENKIPFCQCKNKRFIGTRCEINLDKLINGTLTSPVSESLKDLSCDVLGNDISMLDYVFTALIIFSILIIMLIVIYLYVHYNIKRTKKRYEQSNYEKDVLNELNEVNDRFS